MSKKLTKAVNKIAKVATDYGRLMHKFEKRFDEVFPRPRHLKRRPARRRRNPSPSFETTVVLDNTRYIDQVTVLAAPTLQTLADKVNDFSRASEMSASIGRIEPVEGGGFICPVHHTIRVSTDG